MLLVAAGSGMLLSAPLAPAQSLAGIAIGDTEAKVIKAIPGATSLAIENNPKHRRIYNGETAIWVCSGVVYTVQQSMGSTLTDYISPVERETAGRGKPAVASGVTGAGSSKVGLREAVRTDQGASFEVQTPYTGRQHTVSLNLIGRSPC